MLYRSEGKSFDPARNDFSANQEHGCQDQGTAFHRLRQIDQVLESQENMMEQIDEHLRTIVQEAIEQARREQLDEEDVFWMSCGALLREGRRQSNIGEELSYEMAAAIQTLVKRVMQSN